MVGYGHSIWLIRRNTIGLLRQWTTTHIPHVTLKTNLGKFDAIHEFNRLVKWKKSCGGQDVKIYGKYIQISHSYKNDPLFAYGFKAEIYNIPAFSTPLYPHVSITYSDVFVRDETEKSVSEIWKNADIVLADTKSLNPRDWKILINEHDI
jgi:hypothetical protein